MKNVLVVSPMIEEIELVRDHYKSLLTKVYGEDRWFKGEVNVSFASIGIGAINTLMTLNNIIDKQPIDKVVLVGCAAAISGDISVGDIVGGSRYIDYDAINQMPGYKGPSLLPPQILDGSYYNCKIKLGTCVSTGSFVDTIEDRVSIYNAITGTYGHSSIFVDMESFACVYFCRLRLKSIAVIREISDIAGESSYDGVESFFKKDHSALFDVLDKSILEYWAS